MSGETIIHREFLIVVHGPFQANFEVDIYHIFQVQLKYNIEPSKSQKSYSNMSLPILPFAPLEDYRIEGYIFWTCLSTHPITVKQQLFFHFPPSSSLASSAVSSSPTLTSSCSFAAVRGSSSSYSCSSC